MAYVGMDYFTQGPYQGLPDVFTTYQKYLNDAGTTNPGITGINTNLMCMGEKTSAVLNEINWKKIFLFNPGEEEFLLYKI